MLWARWLKAHVGLLKLGLFLAASAPFLSLVYRWQADTLGANPLATLTDTTGYVSLIMLTLTLLVTPLRHWMRLLARALMTPYGKRAADWNFLVRLRRQLGLWSFAYATAHLTIYLVFDVGGSLELLWLSVEEKPYLWVGLGAWLALVPLALTSPTGVMRRMGRHWLALHRSVYPIAALTLLHFWWQAKPGSWEALPETLILAVLLAYRALLYAGVVARWPGSEGLESPERR